MEVEREFLDDFYLLLKAGAFAVCTESNVFHFVPDNVRNVDGVHSTLMQQGCCSLPKAVEYVQAAEAFLGLELGESLR
ncbi:hypothetical protein D3C81_2080420 [compost metagenome]